jgi:hypothetical protein
VKGITDPFQCKIVVVPIMMFLKRIFALILLSQAHQLLTSLPDDGFQVTATVTDLKEITFFLASSYSFSW